MINEAVDQTPEGLESDAYDDMIWRVMAGKECPECQWQRGITQDGLMFCCPACRATWDATDL